MSENKAPAGWHQDPGDPTQLRYWDGSAWTEEVSPKNASDTGKPTGSAQAKDKPFYQQWWFFAIIGLVIISAISQLSSSSDNVATPAPTVTVTETAEAIPAPTVTVTKKADNNGSDGKTNTSSSNITVPDAVGMDYQTAQDLWRSAGLIVMPANDALGLDRIPIIDSNWVVVSQDLQGGTKVPSDASITATVQKFTD